MKVHATSVFKAPAEGRAFMENWSRSLLEGNGNPYTKMTVSSLLGDTVVWACNAGQTHLKTLVIFPGFRTCSLFWDFDNGLQSLRKRYRIFLVDTNGQPSLSEGNTPAIRSDDYGHWASDLLDKLSISKAVVAGASFGGLVCLKLSMVAPEKVEKAILLNPGCLAPFSLSWRNLYYNMLPIFFPSEKNVLSFLDNAVFYKEHHALKGAAKKLLVDYELYVLKNYVDKGQKPYAMSAAEFRKVPSDIYLLLGEKDSLFPYASSRKIAEKNIQSLKQVRVLPETGHGIETSPEAMRILEEWMELS